MPKSYIFWPRPLLPGLLHCFRLSADPMRVTTQVLSGVGASKGVDLRNDIEGIHNVV